MTGTTEKPSKKRTKAEAAPPIEHAPVPTAPSEGEYQKVPFNTTFPSPLNPRKHFEESSIQELAESIAAHGVQQNLVGRPVGEQIEIIAGGRRWRAVNTLVASGRIPVDFPVPVLVKPLTDLEALEIATAENVQRRNMTPLEEANAFAQMVDLGDTVDEIARKFGYKPKLVASRVRISKHLCAEVKQHLEERKITLGQAEAISLAHSAALQIEILKNYHWDPKHIINFLQKGQFLVEYARFDVAASKLQTHKDLFGDVPEYFTNKQKALELQIEALREQGLRLRQEGQFPWVEVIQNDNSHWPSNWDDREEYMTVGEEHKELCGFVLQLMPSTGQVRELNRVARRKEVKAKEKAQRVAKYPEPESANSTERGITQGVLLDTHRFRLLHLRRAIKNDLRIGLVLTIMGLAGEHEIHIHRDYINSVPDPEKKAFEAAMIQLTTVQETPIFQPHFREYYSKEHTDHMLLLSGKELRPHELYQLLLQLSETTLLQVLSMLVASQFGDVPTHNPKNRPSPLANLIASQLGVETEMRKHWELTEEFLKGHPKDMVVDLAKEAEFHCPGIYEVISNLSTRKDMITKFMEYAQQLREKEWVPQLVLFDDTPEPFKPLNDLEGEQAK
ncbi:ParB/RepB/Spo0J family partition protein [Deinococcus misasensis]|uniref:ParB/RepB/Spo0J family partition protein n=1 Tax=Deinococcus misasensis TaxID=392413 RepID=UPI00068B5E78|nr:ParB/RepB/Spo0J family partition protein [Deinococcus misasensis]